jgi:lysophospholipase L1-like esterase
VTVVFYWNVILDFNGQESTGTSEAITSNEECYNLDKGNDSKFPLNTSQSKVLIIGDSHTKGLSQKVIHNLDYNVAVQGIVTSGANIEAILDYSTQNIETLTNKDIVVVWGGSRDVGKNETKKGLNQLKKFVVKHNHTKFIVLSVLHRHDLDPNSCVNYEVKNYNRKLQKYLKECENAHIIEVHSNRKLFTGHGLHMNAKGKDQIAWMIAQAIKVMVNKETSDPTIQTGIEDRVDLGIGKEDSVSTTEVTQNEDKEMSGPMAHTDKEDKVDPGLDNEDTGRIAEVTQKEGKETSDPIILIDKANRVDPEMDDEDKVVMAEVKKNECKETQATQDDFVDCTQDQIIGKLLPKRTRKPPTTRYEDFLWMDKTTNHQPVVI